MLVDSEDAAYHFHRKLHPPEVLWLLLFNGNVPSHRQELGVFARESQGLKREY